LVKKVIIGFDADADDELKKFISSMLPPASKGN